MCMKFGRSHYETNTEKVTSEVLTPVTMMITGVLNVAPPNMVDTYQRFEGTSCLHFLS
jgi:hypothetical protein